MAVKLRGVNNPGEGKLDTLEVYDVTTLCEVWMVKKKELLLPNVKI